jgi:hypothetical protein
MAFGKSLVVKAFAFVGWDSRETDSHTDKLLRSTVFGLLDTFAWQDEAVATEAKRRFDAHWTDASALPSDYKVTYFKTNIPILTLCLQTTVYKIVLMNGGPTEHKTLLRHYTDSTDLQERKYVLFSLGATRDLSLKRRTLDWAVKSGDVKLQDIYSPFGAVASSVAGSELAWEYYREVCFFISGTVNS